MADVSQASITHRLVFTGRVQGVGFRFTTQALARRHPVTGFVRNRRDGTVELVVQGAPAAVDALVADVAARFERQIAHIDRGAVSTSERFNAFDIR